MKTNLTHFSSLYPTASSRRWPQCSVLCASALMYQLKSCRIGLKLDDKSWNYIVLVSYASLYFIIKECVCVSCILSATTCSVIGSGSLYYLVNASRLKIMPFLWILCYFIFRLKVVPPPIYFICVLQPRILSEKQLFLSTVTWFYVFFITDFFLFKWNVENVVLQKQKIKKNKNQKNKLLSITEKALLSLLCLVKAAYFYGYHYKWIYFSGLALG